MFYERDCRRWLAERYPSLKLREGQNSRLGIWQDTPFWDVYDSDCEGTFRLGEPIEFGYINTGSALVFEIVGRVFGGWIKDEIQKRDPSLWHNPGNLYHDAFLMSLKAESEVDERRRARRESGAEMWKAVRKNDGLMNRIAKHMAAGDMLKAGRELSLENLARNAYIANPSEMRSKDFHKAISVSR